MWYSLFSLFFVSVKHTVSKGWVLSWNTLPIITSFFLGFISTQAQWGVDLSIVTKVQVSESFFTLKVLICWQRFFATVVEKISILTKVSIKISGSKKIPWVTQIHNYERAHQSVPLVYILVIWLYHGTDNHSSVFSNLETEAWDMAVWKWTVLNNFIESGFNLTQILIVRILEMLSFQSRSFSLRKIKWFIEEWNRLLKMLAFFISKFQLCT